MKKIAQINIVINGSTGRLLREIHNEINKQEDLTCLSYYGRGKDVDDSSFIRFGSQLSFVNHVLLTFITNRQGHYAIKQTKRLIKHLEDYSPDIIHMHNVHGYYLNYSIFFDWLNNNFKGKFVWTLHDCWSFTGHCSYFTNAKCDKWKNQCKNCPQKHDYPYSFFFDTSLSEFNTKKRYFTNFNNTIITTPSNWLKDLVKSSFLKKYPVKVINNWVDLNQFKPCIDLSILDKYKISSQKKIILGVANIWEERKGLNIFKKLSFVLPDEYQIVMVGLNNHQIAKLPSNIIGLNRTDNIDELVALYSDSFVLLNPSIEETFSLVTLEALACNTPVIVQDSSAVHEMVTDRSGIILHDFSLDSYIEAVNKITDIDRSKESVRNEILSYNKKDKIKQFLDIYKEGLV